MLERYKKRKIIFVKSWFGIVDDTRLVTYDSYKDEYLMFGTSSVSQKIPKEYFRDLDEDKYNYLKSLE